MIFLLVILATLALWEYVSDLLPIPGYLQYPLVVAVGIGLSFLPVGPVLYGLGAAGAVLLCHIWIKSRQDSGGVQVLNQRSRR